MPIIWTQIQFSEDVVDSIQKTDYFSQYERYMKLGTQFTNLKYFLNLRSKSHKEVNKPIHDNRETYDILLKMVKHTKHKAKHVQAFVFGMVTHYVLEQKVRPYLDYLNHEINNHDKNAGSQIDTLIMKRTYNLKTWKTPVYNEMNIGLFIDKNIVKLLSKVNHPIAQHIQKTYWHLNVALRFYFDPYGWKTKLLPSYEPIYASYSCSQNGIDYLNEYHSKWFNHQTNKISTNNFFQLYDEAKLEATVILNEIVKYWHSHSDHLSDEIVQLLSLVNNNLPTVRSS